ncbi:hypothetical protein ACFQ6B_38805 [Streptomyces wedmorensis]|uniref:DUF4177 domain-containing protein n=1 Tax=Streptomyces wedmorensis TaxID=43759 RepID=A0ABW6J9H0_STRWE
MARITRPRLSWWSLSAALLLAIGAALVLLSPVSGQAKAKGPTAAVAASARPVSAAEPLAARTGGGIAELTKWEYATVPLPLQTTKAVLDSWGADGWDLVQVVPAHPGSNGDGLVAYLKRPKFA